MACIVSERELTIEPTRIIEQPLDCSGFDNGTRLATRETSPYKVGDAIQFGKKFLIIGVFVEYDYLTGFYHLKYKVRNLTKAGGYSKKFSYIYLGQIGERA